MADINYKVYNKVYTSLDMQKVIEVRTAIDDCERKITAQVKRGSNRDRVEIRKLQIEHAGLTDTLATVLKDNREETKDSRDDTAEKYRQGQEVKQKKVKQDFEKQASTKGKEATHDQKELEEFKNKKELAKMKAELKTLKKEEEIEKQRKIDLNLKSD